ncbi:SGNH/GDSL hydrolase family protein [Paenisporosarcina cavernae]|uniref:SGNH/GDSL hydrolase family protein n=1 Tax=Paenisporosarcina cavernae TaxID=2320858 RepID=A0A385YU65_9BACL|nr:SGNH/GDSL hydrolase family protein [Paenisporosarcina cavernae]AYC30415.1 SGNH/GDSL hydrolase family protein [Paenisporosarcina cavernae]
MEKWKWLIWLLAGVLVVFYSRSLTKQDEAIATQNERKTLDQSEESIYHHLLAIQKQYGNVKLAVTGSSVTKGSGASHPSKSWRGLLESHLRLSDPSLRNVSIANHGHSGYTSVRILEKAVTEPIIAYQPDVLFIETSVINNHNKNVPMKETLDSLKQLHDYYQAQLPTTYLVFLSPNPCVENKFGPKINELGYSFEDYIEETSLFLMNQGYVYFNSHAHMKQYMEKHQIAISSTLKDGIHPNDKGYQIWYQTLLPFIYEYREIDKAKIEN